MKKAIYTSEFWFLVATGVLLAGDAILGAFSGNSVFAEYPEARDFLERASLTWAGFRTFLKAVSAWLSKSNVVG